MSQNDTAERQAELDGMIEAFEAACAEHRDVELTDFLPQADHSLYLEARRELVRVDLELSWLDGRRKHLRDYAGMFPDLMQDRTAVQEIAFEEYRVRMLAGEAPATTDYEQQYGVNTTEWARSNASEASGKQETETEIMLTVVQALGKDDSWQSSCGDIAQSLLVQNFQQSNSEAAFLLAQAITALPEIGTDFLAFQLIAGLGSGSFGQVYLARQGDLANRLVALKITVDLQGEEQRLAQLQHTNVVPIFSVHQAGPFHAVCMPFFGSATLADVIRDLQGQASFPTSGKDLVRSIRARMHDLRARVEHLGGETHLQAGAREEGDGAANLRLLEESSYSDAVLLIAERVTEGLMHAHERGILHRDLKPANILLTHDGQPMLLDFNLSADIKLHVGLGELQVGGTLPYMAPEHLEAMQGGAKPVDARSDLYALGVVLFELLTGRLPFETPTGPLAEIVPAMVSDRQRAVPLLRSWNPGVTPAVESMIRKCLQPHPDQRYQSAEELHDDLRRQRHNRPLRHAPEPSIRERARKWARRHPHWVSPASIATMVVALLVLGLAPFAWQVWDRWDRARIDELSLSEKTTAAAKRNLAAHERLREFKQKSTASSRSIVEIVNVMQALPEAWPCEETRLDEKASTCRQTLSLYRVLEDPQWQTQPAVTDLDPADRDRLLLTVSDLLYALATAEQLRVVRLIDQKSQYSPVGFSLTLTAPGREIWNAWEAIIRQRLVTAQRFNALACSCCSADSPARHLEIQKAELTQLQGDRKSAAKIRTRAQAMPVPETGDERYWAATAMLANDRFAEALPLLDEATKKNPDDGGAWLLRGLCEYNLGKAVNAEMSYTTYLTLQPDGVWGAYHRGLLFLSQRDWARAKSDLDAVLKRHPDLAWAYYHRAKARQGLREYANAISDLSNAIRLAPENPEFYFLRAQIHARVGNGERAELDRQHLLLLEPTKFTGWTYRGMARLQADPLGALADFDKALKLNPHSPLTLYNKALVLADALGRPAEAVEVLDKVLEQDTSFVDAHFKRGLLLAGLGKRDQAVADAELLIKKEKTPMRHYQAAEIYAATAPKAPELNPALAPKARGDAKRAIELLAFALRNGYGVERYEKNPHLRSVANYHEFRCLAQALEILGTGDVPSMRSEQR